MYKDRVQYVLIVVALLAATAVSLRQAVTTKAAGVQASQHGSEGLSALSAHADALSDQPQADGSCNAEERLCVSRYAPATALQNGKCLDSECSYQLSNGQWVR